MTEPDDRPNSIFDSLRPPSKELISDCVHCGFCLPACPTYLLSGEEMESPRGRIYLMKAGDEGTVSMDDAFAEHFDSCLGCLSCVTACPSGVQYGALLEAVRPQLERNHPRTGGPGVPGRVFAVFPYPNRLRVAALPGWSTSGCFRPLVVAWACCAGCPGSCRPSKRCYRRFGCTT